MQPISFDPPPPVESVGDAALPTILSPADILRYQRIFTFQDQGEWRAADSEIAGLGDRLLLGSVLAARYLSKPYHASYGELVAWLSHYADEPEAKAIRTLALRRRPPQAKAPPALPVHAPLSSGADESPHAALVARQIETVGLSDPRRAEKLLDGPEAKRVLTSASRKSLRAEIAEAFLRNGDAEEAIVVTSPQQENGASPLEAWEAGLAAWRLRRWGEAGRDFAAMVRSPVQSPWIRSAAAFWEARVAQRLHQPSHAFYWLKRAASAPHTFYGLLAQSALGAGPDLDFAADPFTALDVAALTSSEAGRRALALLAIGERSRAVAELRALAQRDSPALLQTLLGLAERAKLPAFSLEVAGMLGESDGQSHDSARYPVPSWTPLGGFEIDRALLFALMRQESLFVPQVASAAGAVGVMQLMPATAQEMAQREGVVLSRRGNPSDEKKALGDPELNLTLAQDYVRLLLRAPGINDNLILFALAYNAGPGAVEHVKDMSPEDRRDPLLFLESVPSEQARQFTKHVLTNYWIYRFQLGQPTPDLDALAAGRWPTYSAFDPLLEERRYAENR